MDIHKVSSWSDEDFCRALLADPDDGASAATTVPFGSALWEAESRSISPASSVVTALKGYRPEDSHLKPLDEMLSPIHPTRSEIFPSAWEFAGEKLTAADNIMEIAPPLLRPAALSPLASSTELPAPTANAAAAKYSEFQDRHVTGGSSIKRANGGRGEYVLNNMNLADEKRMRKKHINREAAKRSRRKKQEQLTQLETKVSTLEVQQSLLFKQLEQKDEKIAHLEAQLKIAHELLMKANMAFMIPLVFNVSAISPHHFGSFLSPNFGATIDVERGQNQSCRDPPEDQTINKNSPKATTASPSMQREIKM